VGKKKKYFLQHKPNMKKKTSIEKEMGLVRGKRQRLRQGKDGINESTKNNEE